MINHTKVFRMENEGSPLVLKDRHYLFRARLLYNAVIPSTGMCTGSAVGITPGHETAEQASSRVGNAHSTVNKGLDLHIRRSMCAKFPDLAQCQFPGADHALCTQTVPKCNRTIIRIICLCADMPFNLRAYFHCKIKNTGI